ncbi:MAG TPA: hypothetical protein VF183_00805 [Acidimicrobiales bacterium]
MSLHAATATLVKTGASPPARRRLRAEAAALRQARHPDVVRLTLLLDLADRTELHLERAGDHTLLDATPIDGATALQCAAVIASAVADLHAVGIVHGRLGPDHVAVRPDGRPVLCGFAEAGPGDPERDIRALATLFELLAAGVNERSRRDRRAVAALLTAADHARTTMPAPDARELAGMLQTNHAPRRARRGAHARHDVGARRTRRAPRRKVVTLAVIGSVGALVVLAGTGVIDGHASLTFGPEQSAPPREPSTTAIDAPATTGGTTPTPSPDASAGDTTGAVRFHADGATFAVGRAGDSVVAGDFDCDGVTGAALLRPDTGEVYVFDRLATPDAPVTGRLVATMPGGVALEAVAQPSGCDALVMRHADGSPQVLPVRRS